MLAAEACNIGIEPVVDPENPALYGAQVGRKWVVVVNGKEGKPYSGILEGTSIFSPDGTRVVYGAQVGKKWVVVVDGKEGNLYDGFFGERPIIFDTYETFHALAINDSEVLLMSARIK